MDAKSIWKTLIRHNLSILMGFWRQDIDKNIKRSETKSDAATIDELLQVNKNVSDCRFDFDPAWNRLLIHIFTKP